MRDMRETIRRIRALAADQAGTPEGDAAEAALARLRARYGDDLEALFADVTDADVPTPTEPERGLALRIGLYFGLDTMRSGYRRADSGKGTRWRKVIRYRGPEGLVRVAVETYAEHRRQLSELLEYMAAGYRIAAFPVPATEIDGPEPELTREQRSALLAGLRAGRHNQPRRMLAAKETSS